MSMDYPALRRQHLAQTVKDEGLDVLLVSDPVDVSYLTGFSGESSNLILGPNGALLVSDFRFTEQLATECPDLYTYIRPPAQSLPQATTAVLNKLGVRTIGFESAHL